MTEQPIGRPASETRKWGSHPTDGQHDPESGNTQGKVWSQKELAHIYGWGQRTNHENGRNLLNTPTSSLDKNKPGPADTGRPPAETVPDTLDLTEIINQNNREVIEPEIVFEEDKKPNIDLPIIDIDPIEDGDPDSVYFNDMPTDRPDSTGKELVPVPKKETSASGENNGTTGPSAAPAQNEQAMAAQPENKDPDAVQETDTAPDATGTPEVATGTETESGTTPPTVELDMGSAREVFASGKNNEGPGEQPPVNGWDILKPVAPEQEEDLHGQGSDEGAYGENRVKKISRHNKERNTPIKDAWGERKRSFKNLLRHPIKRYKHRKDPWPEERVEIWENRAKILEEINNNHPKTTNELLLAGSAKIATGFTLYMMNKGFDVPVSPGILTGLFLSAGLLAAGTSLGLDKNTEDNLLGKNTFRRLSATCLKAAGGEALFTSAGAPISSDQFGVIFSGLGTLDFGKATYQSYMLREKNHLEKVLAKKVPQGE